MIAPEQLARHKIDELLEAADWILQDRDEFVWTAVLGVAEQSKKYMDHLFQSGRGGKLALPMLRIFAAIAFFIPAAAHADNAYHVSDKIYEMRLQAYSALGILERHNAMRNLVKEEEIDYTHLNECLINLSIQGRDDTMQGPLYVCVKYAREQADQ